MKSKDNKRNFPNRKKTKYIVGIDEVGRGPLAGPVSVGVFVIENKKEYIEKISFARDSKQLSEKAREDIYKKILKLKKEGICDYKVVHKPAEYINRVGISKSIKSAIDNGCKMLQDNPDKYEIRLDGLLKAPIHFKNQKTITKGDQKERVIGAASIIAKVLRDRLMVRYGKKYPDYYFEQHKGYGTKAHRDAIIKNGICEIHRDLYVRNVIREKNTKKLLKT